MSDFSDFDSALGEFFSEFGFEATIIKQLGQTYDTATGENVTTTVNIPVEAILLDLTLQSNGLSAKFGTLVEAGDKELFVRPSEKTDPLRTSLTIAPIQDFVKIGETIYKIVTMKEVNTTASEPLLFDLYIRR